MCWIWTCVSRCCFSWLYIDLCVSFISLIAWISPRNPIYFLYLVYTESNNMVGQIPPEIGVFFAMTSYISFFNAQNGPLPTTLGYITPLETFDVESNNMDGHYFSQNMQAQMACGKLSISGLVSTTSLGLFQLKLGSGRRLRICGLRIIKLLGRFLPRLVLWRKWVSSRRFLCWNKSF